MWWIMVSVAALVGAAASVPCEEARMRCAYRVGCGMALQNYVVGCSGVLQGPPPTYCPEICHHSLIALTSTEEGKDLMNCNCSDEYCEDQKLRSEICRPQVIKTINESVVSCRVAQWICAADALCSTALEYYNHYCRAMFHGKKCSPRCKNSINILRRQEKAAKLTTKFPQARHNQHSLRFRAAPSRRPTRLFTLRGRVIALLGPEPPPPCVRLEAHMVHRPASASASARDKKPGQEYPGGGRGPSATHDAGHTADHPERSPGARGAPRPGPRRSRIRLWSGASMGRISWRSGPLRNVRKLVRVGRWGDLTLSLVFPGSSAKDGPAGAEGGENGECGGLE
ncbi:hypothetical protein Zmor_019639 [Zophobas morio]|uniref:Growth arrest-specific protein 1 n=1 Tax=Zophobas morio TaxID=2755281 RepID=A0AA38I2E1_9CUCU|nr:hypothetical protein Zmor_019639 [Zophobas morio]